VIWKGAEAMKKARIILVAVIFLCAIFAVTSGALAKKIGVGVSLGKIVVDELLLPGGIYRLPQISVINTGDQTNDYTLGVTYHYQQKELEPPAKWFVFSPKIFRLKAGEAKVVKIKLDLPVNAQPGDYFAYLEAYPLAKGKKGVTIGVAAATKLYFTIKPSNIFSAIWWKLVSFFKTNAPYSYIGLGVVGLIIGLILFRKYFSIKFAIERKG